MNGHPEFLELIAMSIDFDLTDEEFGRLSTHLARCPECRRAAEELRGDATAIAAYPPPRLAPARSEQILRAALRTPRPQPRWGMLAVAAMLTTIGGGILFAGFQLINDDDATPSQPPPSLVAEASVPPSVEPPEESVDPGGPPPDDGPRVTPNPGEESSPPVNPGPLAFPLRSSREIDSVRVAPGSQDHLWVTFRRGRDTVMANLDGTGRGKPWVESWVTDCRPHPVSDGSVRILCHYSDAADLDSCPDPCGEWRVYGFTPGGEPLPNFPVSIPRGETALLSAPRVVGKDLVLAVSDYGEDGYGEWGSARALTIGEDGSLREGVRVPAPMRCCAVGPDGTVFGSELVSTSDEDPYTTDVFAIDPAGVRPGWPVSFNGQVFGPSFSPDGALAFTSSDDDVRTQLLRLNADGSPAADPIEIDGEVASNPDGLLAPLVDERGRMWVVVDDAVMAYDSDGQPLTGFPYAPATGFADGERVCDTGSDDPCFAYGKPPMLAPEGLLYVLEGPPEGKGERLSVVNRDGSVRSGWPKTLQRPGARWDTVMIGDNRTAYAVAVEPEPNNEASISILAFAPNGTREWITTLMEP